jgi:rhamnosyltransferase subunit B
MSDYILCTHWSDGDVIPFIRLGKLLKKRGNRVILLTHAKYEKYAEEAEIGFEAWDTQDEYMELMEDLSQYKGSYASEDEIHAFRSKHENIEIRIKELRIIKRYCKKDHTVILAKSGSLIPALVAAELYQCPIAHIFVAPYEVGSTVSFYGLYPDKLNDEANALRKVAGLAPIDNWLLWQCSPKVQIGLWPEWFYDDLQEWPVKIQLVGFPISFEQRSEKKELPTDLKDIWEGGSSPILISGSTGRQVKDEFYKTVISAVGNINRKAVVVTKYKEYLPSTLPPNVVWKERLPFNDILGYFSLIIHHGGIGSLSSALYAGIPQLILASNADRPLNGSIIKHLGVGEYLPPAKWKQNIITEAIEELLTLEYKEKCNSFTKIHGGIDALETICNIAEKIAENPKEYRIHYDPKTYQRAPISINNNSIKQISDLPPEVLEHLLNKMRFTS